MFLLINPPVAKPSEPPAGIARLAGALRACSVPCGVLDASLEGLLWLMGQTPEAPDVWTCRAAGCRDAHLATLRSSIACRNDGRYRRAVSDLNRLVHTASQSSGADVGLADFRHRDYSPVSASDLLDAAREHERNLFHPWFSRRLPELLDGVQVVGLSVNYLSQAVCAFAMAGWLKRHHPRLKTVMGGGLVTSWLRRPGWSSPFGEVADHLVAGPGEEFLLGLAGATLPAGCEPLPDYGGLPLPEYLSPGLVIPYSTATGCWWNSCTFCPERAEGNRFHPLPARRAATELRALNEKHRPALFHLLDSALSPAVLEHLATSPPGAPWYGFARIASPLTDADFCRSLRRSGCVMLKLGIESGDQAVLDRLQKGVRVEAASRVLKNLRQAGIAVYGYLLFGTPAEDEPAARRTLDFTVQHHDELTFLNLALFNMPAFGEEAALHGTGPFYDGNLSLYTAFRHPLGWERSAARRFVDREFSRHPLISPILRRDPPLFTSNHAPFFLPDNRGCLSC